MAIDLTIIIVNFRTPQLTIDCLRSIEPDLAKPGRAAEVIVVDNGSADGSADAIAAAIVDHGWNWVRLVKSERNLGFAGGNNLGWKAAKASAFVLLLNSDTVVHPGCLLHCVERMEREPDIGALGCRLLNVDGSPQTAARRFPTPVREIVQGLGLHVRWPGVFHWADTEDPHWDRHAEQRDVDWLGGAFLMIRGGLFDRGEPLLSPAFFFYGEDVEFCHRVHRLGYRCVYDPRATVTHLGGGSTTSEAVPDERRAIYQFQARYAVQRLCYGEAAAILLRGFDLAAWSARYMWRGMRGMRDRRYEMAKLNCRVLRGRLELRT